MAIGSPTKRVGTPCSAAERVVGRDVRREQRVELRQVRLALLCGPPPTPRRRPRAAPRRRRRRRSPSATPSPGSRRDSEACRKESRAGRRGRRPCPSIPSPSCSDRARPSRPPRTSSLCRVIRILAAADELGKRGQLRLPPVETVQHLVDRGGRVAPLDGGLRASSFSTSASTGQRGSGPTETSRVPSVRPPATVTL